MQGACLQYNRYLPSAPTTSSANQSGRSAVISDWSSAFSVVWKLLWGKPWCYHTPTASFFTYQLTSRTRVVGSIILLASVHRGSHLLIGISHLGCCLDADERPSRTDSVQGKDAQKPRYWEERGGTRDWHGWIWISMNIRRYPLHSWIWMDMDKASNLTDGYGWMVQNLSWIWMDMDGCAELSWILMNMGRPHLWVGLDWMDLCSL